jgi:polyprenyldihydroxybenzoate methyltransferase/3-demethylubiquinol 3-O-methyltransferase
LFQPGGSLFFTTINKTQLSYYLGVIAAEYIFGIVPRGTHDWEKFVPPEELKFMLNKSK